MKLVYVPLLIWLLASATWLFFLAIMSLMRVRDQLTLPAKIFAYPMAAIGILLDFLTNMIVATALFIEIPKEFLFTARCDRWIPSKTWRGAMARWFCRNYLDPFELGGHCHPD